MPETQVENTPTIGQRLIILGLVVSTYLLVPLCVHLFILFCTHPL